MIGMPISRLESLRDKTTCIEDIWGAPDMNNEVRQVFLRLKRSLTVHDAGFDYLTFVDLCYSLGVNIDFWIVEFDCMSPDKESISAISPYCDWKWENGKVVWLSEDSLPNHVFSGSILKPLYSTEIINADA